MTSIERSIIEALENNVSISLDNLGGINHLLQQDDDFFRSKLLDQVLKVAINDIDLESQDALKNLTSFANKCLNLNDDEIVVKEIALAISANADQMIGCFKELISLLTESKRNGFFRSQYLISAFSLSLNSSSHKYSLMAYLLEDQNLEELYKECYFKILGLSYSHFNQEDLFEKLQELIDLNPNDELLYELGMAHMYKALNAETISQAQLNFKTARDYFLKVDSSTYSNAVCYEAAIDIFLDYFNSENGNIDPEKILELNNQIEFSKVWHSYKEEFSWQSLRETELINWRKLVSILKESSNHLNETTWFEPKVVIENYLLQLYKCNRTIFLKRESKGIDLFIEPVLTSKLIGNDTYFFLLEQWLKKCEGSNLWENANELHQQIIDYKSLYKQGNDIGVTESTCSVTPKIIKFPNSKSKTEFEIFSKQYRFNQLASTSIILKAEFESLSKKLIESGVLITEEVKYNFQWLLYNTLMFLESRLDWTKRHYESLSYLFAKSPLPKEDKLQLDYSTFMKTVPSEANTEIEVMDVAGGRADVIFRFIDHRFVAEVKRETSQNNFEHIIKKYSSQSFEYQNTSVKAGILLVLDLNKANLNGIKAFEQQVHLHTKKDSEDKNRALVIIKVPGRRNTPSQIKGAD